MIQPHGQEFRYGKYYGEKNGLEQEVKMFKYEMLTDKDYQYSSLARSLITRKGSIGIRTSYDHKWRIRGIIELQDGKRYMINTIYVVEDMSAPQVSSIVKLSKRILHYMELIELVIKQ